MPVAAARSASRLSRCNKQLGNVYWPVVQPAALLSAFYCVSGTLCSLGCRCFMSPSILVFKYAVWFLSQRHNKWPFSFYTLRFMAKTTIVTYFFNYCKAVIRNRALRVAPLATVLTVFSLSFK